LLMTVCGDLVSMASCCLEDQLYARPGSYSTTKSEHWEDT